MDSSIARRSACAERHLGHGPIQIAASCRAVASASPPNRVRGIAVLLCSTR